MKKQILPAGYGGWLNQRCLSSFLKKDLDFKSTFLEEKKGAINLSLTRPCKIKVGADMSTQNHGQSCINTPTLNMISSGCCFIPSHHSLPPQAFPSPFLACYICTLFNEHICILSLCFQPETLSSPYHWHLSAVSNSDLVPNPHFLLFNFHSFTLVFASTAILSMGQLQPSFF